MLRLLFIEDLFDLLRDGKAQGMMALRTHVNIIHGGRLGELRSVQHLDAVGLGDAGVHSRELDGFLMTQQTAILRS